jgi:hypothetical protein
MRYALPHTRRIQSHKGILGFDTFVEEMDQQRNSQDVGPDPMQPGTFQVDPDKEDPNADLAAALEEIIELAKKALEMREKGLGDENPNQKPGNEEQEGAPMSNLSQRPKADSPEGMFGGDQ